MKNTVGAKHLPLSYSGQTIFSVACKKARELYFHCKCFALIYIHKPPEEYNATGIYPGNIHKSKKRGREGI